MSKQKFSVAIFKWLDSEAKAKEPWQVHLMSGELRWAWKEFYGWENGVFPYAMKHLFHEQKVSEGVDKIYSFAGALYAYGF